MPFPGETARAFRNGALTCPDSSYGKVTWKEFLRRKFDPATPQTSSARGRTHGRG